MKYKYDIFISYNSKDRDIVEIFVKALPKLQLSPFLDLWDLTPGKPWQEELESALSRSKHIAIFIGKDGLGRWQNEEMRVALEHSLKHNDVTVIPILLPDADINSVPAFLSRLTWVDFREGVDDFREYRKFLSSLGIEEKEISESNLFKENKKIVKNILITASIDYNDIDFDNRVIGFSISLLILVISFYNNSKQESIYLLIFLILFIVFVIKEYSEKFYNKFTINRNNFSNYINNIRHSTGMKLVHIKKQDQVCYVKCEQCKSKTPSMIMKDKYMLLVRSCKILLSIILFLYTFQIILIDVEKLLYEPTDHILKFLLNSSIVFFLALFTISSLTILKNITAFFKAYSIIILSFIYLPVVLKAISVDESFESIISLVTAIIILYLYLSRCLFFYFKYKCLVCDSVNKEDCNLVRKVGL